MYNDKKLRIAMIEKEYSVKALAKAIEINESTLYRKINGESEFTLAEMQRICRILSINGSGIFFDPELA